MEKGMRCRRKKGRSRDTGGRVDDATMMRLNLLTVLNFRLPPKNVAEARNRTTRK
jgi:hypothetical protein